MSAVSEENKKLPHLQLTPFAWPLIAAVTVLAEEESTSNGRQFQRASRDVVMLKIPGSEIPNV